jgi:hypothetical protein
MAREKRPRGPSDSLETMGEPRRNPKRKVAESAHSHLNVPEKLLEETLSPLTTSEIEGLEGWVELESEPVSLLRALTSAVIRRGLVCRAIHALLRL